MKVLLVVRSTLYVRNLESTIRLLAQRGHEVRVVAQPYHEDDSNELLNRLCADLPGVTHELPPPVPFDEWSFLGTELRRGGDYLRYLGPEFAGASKLRARALRNAPFYLHLIDRPWMRSAIGRRVLAGALRLCDRVIPRSPVMDEFIRRHAPDLLVVTPLVEPGAPQTEYLRAARAAGVPTALCVYSWDNLTNKGLIHDPLDLVTVWNEAMKAEAVRFHGVPADRVVVTGAQSYDHWFSWTPRESRADFCARVGLAADRPYLLYLCSSRFIAPKEVTFIRRWLAALRAGPPALAGVSVLVRPHPQNTEMWEGVDLEDPHVQVWPRGGANPVGASSRADYFDSIYHSAAVLGVNTSAQIESAVVGRGVYTVLDPEFRDTQEGTLHFHHLQDANGGLLHVAQDFAEHHTQLAAALAAPQDDRCRRFVETFVRPYGLNVEATARVVETLEAAGARPTAFRDRGPWWGPILRPLLAPAAHRAAGTRRARAEKLTRKERAKAHQDAERRAVRQAHQQAKQAENDARQARLAEEARRADEARAVRQRVEARAVTRYQEVRAWADRLPVLAAERYTAAETARVGALSCLWDASPDTIADLRAVLGALEGARREDYRDKTSDFKIALRRRLTTLLHAARDLYVPEPQVLGAFGFSSKSAGGIYNQDSLRFYESLVALRDAALLSPLSAPGPRRLVWEIGGGWGGFAHRLKTVCPNVTYLITGHPAHLLTSATYLAVAHPGARMALFDPSSARRLWDDWERADFIFVPDAMVAELEPPRLDLMADVGALALMTPERSALHARRAFELGAPFGYAMAPTRLCPASAGTVAAAFEPRFWLHPVPHRTDGQLEPDSNQPPFVPDHGHDHLAAWRRLRA